VAGAELLLSSLLFLLVGLQVTPIVGDIRGHPQHGAEGAKAQLAVLEHEREVLGDMRRERAFPGELLRSLEAELDVDEARTRSRGR
jgi:hypothetical protein